MKQTTKKPGKGRLAAKIAAGLALVLAISLYFTVMASARNTYTITDGDRVLCYSTTETDIDAVLTEAGITLSEDDLVSASTAGAATEINIQRSRCVTIDNLGEQIATATYETTVGALLESLGITPKGGAVMLSGGMVLSEGAPVTENMHIAISETTRETFTETTELPYTSTTYQDPTLRVGETKVKIPGAVGQQETTYENIYVNGVLTDTVTVHTRILSAPVDEVILEGAAVSAPQEASILLEAYVEPTPEPTPVPTPEPTPEPYYEPEYYEPEYYEPEPENEPEPDYDYDSGNYFTTPSGEVISYVDCFTVESTAYCGGGTTATGTPARYGAVAVDPSVIPYGTVMYIISNDGRWDYGIATAEDCGGAIDGYMVDLYFDSYNTCINFGRRNCTVYIIEWG